MKSKREFVIDLGDDKKLTQIVCSEIINGVRHSGSMFPNETLHLVEIDPEWDALVEEMIGVLKNTNVHFPEVRNVLSKLEAYRAKEKSE